MVEITDDYVERVAQFGPSRSLTGILAQPVGHVEDKPAVIILNTGIVHRVGHYRMYVPVSRKLARAGNVVLRFDFSGIGDSTAHPSGKPLLESNLLDIKAAIDWLQTTYQVSRVILVGLCSGADHAVLYGYSDPRVVGLVLIDPYIPPTVRYFVDYFSRRISNPRSWRRFNPRSSRFLSRLFERLIFRRVQKNVEPGHLTFPGLHARAALEGVYRATVDAGIRLLVICTGKHYAPRVTYREQFIKAFASVSFEGVLQLHYLEEADHTFSSVRSRDEFNSLIGRWCGVTKFAEPAYRDASLTVAAP